jgi:uncharacterized FlgJ-related protein
MVERKDFSPRLKYTVLTLVVVMLASGICFAASLPGLPEHLTKPFRLAKRQYMASAVDLQRLFAENHCEIAVIRQSRQLPSIFVANLPPDLNALPVHQKTSLFIRLLLTSVVKVNDNIMAVRIEIKRLATKQQQGSPLSMREQEWLAGVAADYYCDVSQFSELLQRIDILPVSLILAQAIDESGWGTSHFAKKGNALYGQHLASHSKGTFLTTPGGHVKIATFDNLYHGTASYIHNINTTRAYAAHRDERAKFRAQHGYLSGDHLAGTLGHYSVRGQHYVKTLRWLMQHYQLAELDNAKLVEKESSLLVIFSEAVPAEKR